jgi:hypothetical protein
MHYAGQHRRFELRISEAFFFQLSHKHDLYPTVNNAYLKNTGERKK